MSDKIRCHCRRCTIRGLMGPAMIITVGILFLLSEMRGEYDFWRLSPILLIVAGAISLASALAPMDGHVANVATAPPYVAPGAAVPPSSVPPQPPYTNQGQA